MKAILFAMLLYSLSAAAQADQTVIQSRCEDVASLAYNAGVYRTGGKVYSEWMDRFDLQVQIHPSYENIRHQVARVGQLVYAAPNADPALNRMTMRQYCIKFPGEFFDAGTY